MGRVAAQAASRSPVIKRRHGISVIYRKHGAGFPLGRPVLKPAVVGFMHLHTLACVEGMLENCGVRDCAVLQNFVASPVFNAHVKFQPISGGALKNAAPRQTVDLGASGIIEPEEHSVTVVALFPNRLGQRAQPASNRVA